MNSETELLPPEAPAPPGPAPNQALTRQTTGAVAEALSVEQVTQQLEYIRAVMARNMTEGTDYGKVPGCGDKPGLFQPGAQKLGLTFQLTPSVKQETLKEYPPYHREYSFIVTVTSKTGRQWDGVGTCSTLESKYRYRKAERKCPVCGKHAIIQGKEEYGGGWVCFKKKGGCGAKFAYDDQKIQGQAAGQVESENPADYWNTVRKMAFKRCIGSTTPLMVLTDRGHTLTNPSGLYQIFRKAKKPIHIQNGNSAWVKLCGMSREENRPCLSITLADGQSIIATPEHRFLTTSGLKAVSELTPGDVLERRRIYLCGGDANLIRDAGWFVGMFIAEGHFATRTAIRFTLHAKESSFAMRILHFGESLGCSGSAKQRPVGNTQDVCIYGESVVGFLKQFVSGHSCYTKHLTTEAWRQGDQFLRDVLTGWLDGDARLLCREGRRQKKYDFRFTGRNYELANDVRAICSVLGLRVKILRRTGSCNGKKFPVFRGWVSGDAPKYNGLALAKIVAIKQTKPSTVYDLEIACASHLFCLASGIVSHNSFVHAIINATNTSELWSQDLEDLPGVGGDEPPPPPPPPLRAAGPTASREPGPSQHTTQPGKAPPAPRTAAKPAVEATPDQKARFLELLKPHAAAALEYCRDQAWLLPNETLPELPIVHVPTTKFHADRILAAVQQWEREHPANAPAEGGPDLWWRNIIVPIPRAGQRRDDYLKAPDTIGSLYDCRHDEDETARNRLWGFIERYEVETTWKGKDGNVHNRSQTEIEALTKFRKALDACKAFIDEQDTPTP